MWWLSIKNALYIESIPKEMVYSRCKSHKAAFVILEKNTFFVTESVNDV